LLAEFERDYDVDRYSIYEYFEYIQSPIQLHQGTIDDAVPVEWSDYFNGWMKQMDKDITYYVYSGTDHNLRPNWNTAINRDLVFFRQY